MEIRVSDVEVTDVPECSRYEARSGGELLGLLDYHRKPGIIVYDHAEVEPRYRGNGIAAQLVAKALGDAREEGMQIEPRCPYVRRWVEDHPEFRSLVA